MFFPTEEEEDEIFYSGRNLTPWEDFKLYYLKALFVPNKKRLINTLKFLKEGPIIMSVLFLAAILLNYFIALEAAMLLFAVIIKALRFII